MADSENSENESRNWLMDLLIGKDMVGYTIRFTMLPILLYLGIFIWGLVSALLDPQGAAAYWAYFRNLIEIILAMAAILIFIAMGIFVVQIARFINLLRSEIKPISDDAKLALKNVRVSAEFVQKHGIAPIIRFQAFLAGLIAFLSEIIRVSRLLQERKTEADEDESSNEQEYFN